MTSSKTEQAELTLPSSKPSPKPAPQTTKQIHQQISRYRSLEETYYASLTERLRRLHEEGFITETKQATGQKSYKLQMKAYLATFLNEYSMQDILTQPQTPKSLKSCCRY